MTRNNIDKSHRLFSASFPFTVDSAPICFATCNPKMANFGDAFLYAPTPKFLHIEDGNFIGRYDHCGRLIPIQQRCPGISRHGPILDNSIPANNPPIRYYNHDITVVSSPYSHLLFGYSLSWHPNLATIADGLASLFYHSHFAIGNIDRHCVWIQFADDRDYCITALERSMMIRDSHMFFTKWLPDLDSPLQSPFLACWVIFPELVREETNPFEALELAKRFGRPLMIYGYPDETWTKVLVEINVSLSFPTCVRWPHKNDPDGCVFTMFENLPSYCAYCRFIGHSFVNWLERDDLPPGDDHSTASSEN